MWGQTGETHPRHQLFRRRGISRTFSSASSSALGRGRAMMLCSALLHFRQSIAHARARPPSMPNNCARRRSSKNNGHPALGDDDSTTQGKRRGGLLPTPTIRAPASCAYGWMKRWDWDQWFVRGGEGGRDWGMHGGGAPSTNITAAGQRTWLHVGDHKAHKGRQDVSNK